MSFRSKIYETNYTMLMSLIYFRLLSLRQSAFMLPQIKNSDFGLFKYFRVASSLSINWLKFADGALYKANILNVLCTLPSKKCLCQ
jgi:hypothetical protein